MMIKLLMIDISCQALENKSITIYGSGEQTRSFQYVSDLVQGLVTLMASDYILPVNIGNPQERSIKTFATLIKEMVGSSSEIVNEPEVEDDPQKRRPDISTAAKMIGWAPRVPLEKGLTVTIDYFRNELKRSNNEKNQNNEQVATAYFL